MPQGKSDEARLRKNRKRFLLVVAYLVLLLPWVAIGAKRALQESANSPLDWVDDHFTPRRDYDHFCSVFGSADALIAAVEKLCDSPEASSALRPLARAEFEAKYTADVNYQMMMDAYANAQRVSDARHA